MNFKSIGFALAATSVVAAGIVSAPSSAQAATLNPNNRLSFIGAGNFINPAAGFTFTPKSVVVTEQTGFFSSLSTTPSAGFPFEGNPVGTIANIASVPFAGTLDFLSFPGADPKFDFTLTSFTPVSGNLYEFAGFFGDSEYIRYGEFTVQGGNSFSAAVAVPTPALLPGLIGMGVAALRKKRKGEGFEATPEATEANA
ncbi:hypothetical protein C7B61_01265 [filamentous cyanobacterium CCP1]|nr:hypothetical protein C7B76_07745 [filamentous cyanobacterium CCP2]PSB68362.1 hypothetical protein C7B61_01265 [filamentous cyanobacterium CCP1]